MQEAGHDAAGHPVVTQSLDRADERIAIGGKRERTVHDLADARFGDADDDRWTLRFITDGASPKAAAMRRAIDRSSSLGTSRC